MQAPSHKHTSPLLIFVSVCMAALHFYQRSVEHGYILLTQMQGTISKGIMQLHISRTHHCSLLQSKPSHMPVLCY